MNNPPGSEIKLVLGSSSPRRESLLRLIGAEFDVFAPDIDESYPVNAPLREYVEALALRKALAVRERLKTSARFAGYRGRAIIISADTIVASADGETLGKPEDAGDAEKILAKLAGRWHEVYTGVALAGARIGAEQTPQDPICAEQTPRDPICAEQAPRDPICGGPCVGHEKTRVKMCDMSAAEIARYARSGEPLGKAGAYAVQGAGSLFIERIDGCYYNVVGLPLRLLYTMLLKFGYDLSAAPARQ